MSNKYSLKTPKVNDYCDWLAIPRRLRDEDEKSVEQYMEKYEIKSRTTLSSYGRMDGFQDELARRQKKFASYFVYRANKNLLKAADGGSKKSLTVRTLPTGEKITTQTIEDIAPDVFANVTLLKVHGGFVESFNLIKDKAALDAAAELDKEEKEASKNGKGKKG